MYYRSKNVSFQPRTKLKKKKKKERKCHEAIENPIYLTIAPFVVSYLEDRK